MKKAITAILALFLLLSLGRAEAVQIDLPIQSTKQLLDQWCWAGVMLSILNRFDKYPGVTPGIDDNPYGYTACVIS